MFVTSNKVVKLDQDENYNESCDVSLCESSLSTMSPAPPSHSRSYSATPTTTRVRRSLSLRHHENKSATPSMTGSMNSKAPSNFSRCYCGDIRKSFCNHCFFQKLFCAAKE